jgi:polysaccharide pyruvyl transferase CsaB
MPAGARSILIAGYFGFGNAGDEAILAAMLADLRRLRPDLDAVVASGSPAATAAEHGVRAVPRDDLPAVIAAVRASDLVLLGGGGLFEDYWEVPLERIFTPRSGGLPFYAGFALLAAWLGRPAMVYAAGVGPLTSAEGRRLTRVVFDLSAAATVRDEKSLALLESLGARAEVAADPAFGFATSVSDPKSLAPLLASLGLAPGERPVGVALRPWSFGPDPEVWEGEVAAGLGTFLAGSEERLLLLPFQAGDLDLLRRLRAALGAGGRDRDRVLLAERRLTPTELAGVTASCGRVLAMRYHAALFALAAGVPVAALAYDPKVASLLAAADLADVSLEPEDWREEEIVRVLRQARAPAAGFPEAMRRRAVRSAELAIGLLEREPPAVSSASAASEAARFLDDLAVEKVAAAFRLEIERSERRSAQERDAAEAAQVARDLAAANARIPRLEQEAAALREQRELILAERNDLDRRLTALERTLAYRLVSRFWRLLRQVFPEGSRRRKLYRLGRRAVGKLLGARDPAGTAAWTAGAGGAAAGEAPDGSPDFRAELLRFEERVRAGGAPPSQQVVAIFSGTQLVESEGQRPTQLALALARRGIPVVFVYWRWWDHDQCPQDRLEEGIVQIPIDVVTRRPEMLTGAFAGAERIALFEFPHPAFFATLSAANSQGWITVYDMLDDWEEFHRVGQAIWWDEDFERHLTAGCDAVFGINEVLAGRLRALGGGAADAAEVVGNGLKPGLGTVGEARPLARGEVTVGYFGYLAGAWFDWELVLAAARRRPAWRFYLIGYGGAPEGSDLPPNIELLGKQPQSDLAAFAANWDVAVVPFKPDRLAAGADPIKTYEYLAMGLPVVVTGVHPPPGGEAFVRRAEGIDELLQAIEQSGGRGGAEKEAARSAFAAGCSWDHRLESLLASLAEGRQRVAEKRALFATASEGGEPAP